VEPVKPPTNPPQCADCGRPTSLGVVDLLDASDATPIVWLCWRCITARYSDDLGQRRHLEELP
jgi:hypothetical protein